MSDSDWRCLPEMLDAQAARTPDAVAVVHGSEWLTYRELHMAAGRLAAVLRSRGVGPESLVGVLSTRTSRLIAALLAVVKAGGAYLPLDPDHPPARLAFMLDDARPAVLLGERALLERLPATASPPVTLCLDDQPADGRQAGPAAGLSPGNLAYVMYTSGSTGRPKAVMVEHRSLVNHLHLVLEEFSPDAFAATLAATSVGFDPSGTELFATLACGGRIILVDSHLALADLPHMADVTLVDAVTSAMSALVSSGALPGRVHTVITGGEPVPPALVRTLYEANVGRVFNAYGPTEATIYATGTTLTADPDVPVSIGRPAANMRAYVLDAGLGQVPAGVRGELFIGGVGVARGYLRRPGLTAERFLPDHLDPEPGRRMYRTGDLARWRSDGDLEYLGRVDQQVKVRGMRVELGEIEATLARHPAVGAAAVAALETAPGSRRLVGYVVAAKPGEIDAGELRTFLARHLPGHMVPTVIVRLDALPLTRSGKLDRQALPPPAGTRSRIDAGGRPG